MVDLSGSNPTPDVKELLKRLSYQQNRIFIIINHLNTLTKEIDFDEIKERYIRAADEKDITGLIGLLKDLMVSLENKGYYRPDFPVPLIKLLVNGLNHKNEDIFSVIAQSELSRKEKLKEIEFLASCAAITQLGYILLSFLVPDVRAASAGPHVFTIIDGYSPNSSIFVDFSIGSIREINIQQVYDQKENIYNLKNITTLSGLDQETSDFLTKYYHAIQITSGFGLSHNIHNNMGIAYDKIDRYEDAEAELQEALKLSPAYAEAHNNLGVVYYKTGRVEEAISEFQEALRLNPKHAGSRINLGILYAESGKYEEAIIEFKEALALDPEYALAYSNLGSIYAELGRHEEAIIEFKEALKLDPEYVEARNNLGMTYAELGRYEDAAGELREAVRVDPDYVEAYTNLASVYYKTGKYEKAVLAWVNAVLLKPELIEDVPENLLLKVRQGVARLGV